MNHPLERTIKRLEKLLILAENEPILNLSPGELGELDEEGDLQLLQAKADREQIKAEIIIIKSYLA